MVSVASASRDQSRFSMYIRGLIPTNWPRQFPLVFVVSVLWVDVVVGQVSLTTLTYFILLYMLVFGWAHHCLTLCTSMLTAFGF